MDDLQYKRKYLKSKSKYEHLKKNCQTGGTMQEIKKLGEKRKGEFEREYNIDPEKEFNPRCQDADECHKVVEYALFSGSYGYEEYGNSHIDTRDLPNDKNIENWFTSECGDEGLFSFHIVKGDAYLHSFAIEKFKLASGEKCYFIYQAYKYVYPLLGNTAVMTDFNIVYQKTKNKKIDDRIPDLEYNINSNTKRPFYKSDSGWFKDQNLASDYRSFALDADNSLPIPYSTETQIIAFLSDLVNAVYNLNNTDADAVFEKVFGVSMHAFTEAQDELKAPTKLQTQLKIKYKFYKIGAMPGK